MFIANQSISFYVMETLALKGLISKTTYFAEKIN